MLGTELLRVCCAFLQIEKVLDVLLVIMFSNAITNGKLLPTPSLTLQKIHLVRCLTHISHRYFAPGRSVVISSPANYRDVQQELIAEIHGTSIWPVVVAVDGNITIPEKSNFIDRDGSYIILIPDGNINYFMTEINGLVEETFGYTRLWNSEARFVVAGANEFSLSQQIEIFDHFSKLRIYNCIVVSLEHDVIHKLYEIPIKFNDVEKCIPLVVYTWFPYQNSNRCTEVNDITQLDSWVISAQGYFTKNTDLFPRKIGKSFNGCPMQALVRDGEWDFTTMYVQYNDSNYNVLTTILGVEINLLIVVLQYMNMSFYHVPSGNVFEMENVQVDNVIGAMFSKKAYIALGGLGTHLLSLSYVDYTYPYFLMSVSWYVPCSVKYPRWSSIFRILSVELWLVLILSIVIAAISITFVGRYSCTSEWKGYKTLSSSLTNLWAVILGVPVSTTPRALSLRSLFLAWVCFSLAFSTVLKAFLTTFLIESGYKTPIQNVDEMFASGIQLAYTSGYNFIVENGDETEKSKVESNRVNCPPNLDCAYWAMNQRNVSILIYDMVAEINYANGGFVGENSEPLFCRLEDGVAYSSGLGMIMFHGDPLMGRVSNIIDRVVQSGIYKYWISLRLNWLKIAARKIALVHPLDEYYSFNLYHMQPAFYVLLMGWCLSALCFALELTYNRVLHKRIRVR